MRRVDTGLVIAGLSLVLGVANHGIWRKERVIDTGREVLLELRPVDPRSLMQGDYMQLRYVEKTFPTRAMSEDMPHKGTYVLKLDQNNVASFARKDDDTALAADEFRLQYYGNTWIGDLRIGADSYLFQEGQAPLYQNARYGILRVDESGDSVLVGLADEAHQPITPP
jgi:uncharacterized membrane-anchored protein